MTPRRSAPLRTCVGCRRVRPQAELLRLGRGPDGQVVPDPDRRVVGRGAYLCRRDSCLLESVRRGRWPHAFRGPAVATPEAILAAVEKWLATQEAEQAAAQAAAAEQAAAAAEPRAEHAEDAEAR